jgi:hypothetical protein
MDEDISFYITFKEDSSIPMAFRFPIIASTALQKMKLSNFGA